jgi:hypothetical protein
VLHEDFPLSLDSIEQLSFTNCLTARDKKPIFTQANEGSVAFEEYTNPI